MLKEISKMEQRYDAVLMVLRDGFAVSEVAAKFAVSRQTLYKWMADYEAEGLEGLKDRSHAPQRVPHQLDGEREAAIIRLRLAHPRWGPVTIAHHLTREGLTPPSLMTIHRVLSRKGLIVERAARKKLPAYRRWERARPMELWQMDVVGGVLTEAGVEAKILTGIDDHSRFIVCAGVMARATLRPVCAHLVDALERHGVPEEILTDIQTGWTLLTGCIPAGCARIGGVRRLSVIDTDRSERVASLDSLPVVLGADGSSVGGDTPY